jgi:hypothetical protein
MEAASVGGDPQPGHPVVLRRMAGHMRAGAAMGKVPHAAGPLEILLAHPDYKCADLATDPWASAAPAAT